MSKKNIDTIALEQKRFGFIKTQWINYTESCKANNAKETNT
jgi:hypothetical protein